VSDAQSLRRGSRGEAAQTFYGIVWEMRNAHFPHNTIKQVGAAGAGKQVWFRTTRSNRRAPLARASAGDGKQTDSESVSDAQRFCLLAPGLAQTGRTKN